LFEFIMEAARRSSPFSESEHAARQVQLQCSIDEASHALARAQESSAVDYDALLTPGQIPGLRVEAEGENAAAA
jgi:hypothetical protein